MQKTLYERRKGKEMRASGSWSVTGTERRMINAVGIFFAAGVIAVLVSPLIHRSWFTAASIVCCAVSFVLMFVVLFGLVIKKSREKPMEMHTYDVDYTYNAITGRTEDKTVETTNKEDR